MTIEMQAPRTTTLQREYIIPHRAFGGERYPRLFAGQVALALSLLGCTGELRTPEARGVDDTPPPGSRGVDAEGKPLPITAAATNLRRLGRVELNHSVHALLPDLPSDFDAGADVPEDNHVELAFALPGTVSEVEVKRFSDLAEEAIARLAQQSPGAQFNCAADEATCAREFVSEFTERAFRRPAMPTEIDDLMALYEKLRSDPEVTFEFGETLNILVEALLQSPGFLYRWERGPQGPEMDGELVKFDSFEMASRLSYFLWNSVPDEALLAEARAGGLRGADSLEVQTRRMIADAKFDSALTDFVTQWLELSDLPDVVKDAGVYPRFSQGLGQAMLDEAQNVALDVFRSDDPSLSHLLTTEHTRVSPELADYYGVTVTADGSASLAGTGRKGILMQGGFLTAKGNSYRTSPVRRGKLILNRLLCENVPPPPPDAVVDLPAADPNLTLRQQMDLHASSPSCRNCHNTMDPLGLAFEHFDGAGAYRELEGTLAIDSSGTLSYGNIEWSFDDATGLVDALIEEQKVTDCFARQWVRYALDRFEQKDEAGAVAQILDAHEQSGSTLPELLVAITQSKPFTHRALRDGEVPAP